MSVFNAGSCNRDAYFMLKLLTLALKEEIKINCTKAAEIKTSNLYILKAIVDQARCFDNQKRLNTIFKTVVEKVIINVFFFIYFKTLQNINYLMFCALLFEI